MKDKTIQILLVDDDEEDFIIVRDFLKDVKQQRYAIEWASDHKIAMEKIATQSYDIILIDFLLGKFSGIELIVKIREVNTLVPVILFTGVSNEKVDMEAMNAGASDYIVKGEINASTLERSIRYSINQAEILRKLLENEQSLRSAEKFAVTGRVAQIVAHEVRNPLTNIKLAWEQMKEEIQNPSEIITTLGNLIERNCDRINLLITSLLDSTKFLQLNFEHTTLNQLVEETILLAEDRISLKQANIIRNYTPQECYVYVDKDKIKIALLNIVVNATEAIEKAKGTITFSTELVNGKCILSIMNDGKGIDPEYLSRIFEPYFTNKENGKGLGLTTAQNIILNHKGDIKVESQTNSTSFFISFDYVSKPAID